MTGPKEAVSGGGIWRPGKGCGSGQEVRTEACALQLQLGPVFVSPSWPVFNGWLPYAGC